MRVLAVESTTAGRPYQATFDFTRGTFAHAMSHSHANSADCIPHLPPRASLYPAPPLLWLRQLGSQLRAYCYTCMNLYLLLVTLDHQSAQVDGGADADAVGRLLLEEAEVSDRITSQRRMKSYDEVLITRKGRRITSQATRRGEGCRDHEDRQ